MTTQKRTKQQAMCLINVLSDFKQTDENENEKRNLKKKYFSKYIE